MLRAWKWYNIQCFMGEKTQENSVMGYSAAYPTDAPEKLCFGGEPRRKASPKGPQGAARERIVI